MRQTFWSSLLLKAGGGIQLGRIASVLCIAFTSMAVSLPVNAESLTKKNQRKLMKSHLKILDSRAAQQYSYSKRLLPPSNHHTGGYRKAGYHGKYRGEYLSLAKAAARKHDIPEDLFARLVQQESGWNPSAKSHKGALGLAQLMPGTARELGVDPHDPRQNLEGGARYLAQQYREFGSWRLALAAYNAGPEAVRKHGGVPPYRETRHYVKAIWGS